MRYLATVARRKHDNPWEPFISLLKETADPRPTPRKLSLWQMYMIKKPEHIAAVVEERWPTAGLREEGKFAFRAQVARELLEAESSTYHADLQAEVEAEHMRAMDEFEKEQNIRVQTARTSEEVQTKYVRRHGDHFYFADAHAVRTVSARVNLSAVVEPLLNLIRQHTGFHLVLFAGIPLKDATKGPFDLKTYVITYF